MLPSILIMAMVHAILHCTHIVRVKRPVGTGCVNVDLGLGDISMSFGVSSRKHIFYMVVCGVWEHG